MGSKKIMIADDAAFMRRMIRMTLEEAGFEDFIEARDGQEAVNLYMESKPALVLLDVTMPVKNGIDTLREIIQFDPRAKVVMCSAIGQDSTIMDAIRTGASEFIVKPFKKNNLIEVVNSLI